MVSLCNLPVCITNVREESKALFVSERIVNVSLLWRTIVANDACFFSLFYCAIIHCEYYETTDGCDCHEHHS